MSNPVDKTSFDPGAAAEQQVREVYQQLPEPEPGAGIDARIRAAVAAELSGGSGGEKENTPIIFPWWRRAAVPLALAATVVLTLGLSAGWFWMEQRLEPRGGVIDLLAQAPVPAPALAPAPVYKPASVDLLGRSAESPDVLREAQGIAEIEQVDSARVPEARVRGEVDFQHASPPPKAAYSASELPERFNQDKPEGKVARQEQDKEFSLAPEELAPTEPPPILAVQPSAARQSEDQKLRTSPPLPDERRTLEKIRALLVANRREEARLLFKKWKHDHPDAVVPSDLQGFAKEQKE